MDELFNNILDNKDNDNADVNVSANTSQVSPEAPTPPPQQPAQASPSAQQQTTNQQPSYQPYNSAYNGAQTNNNAYQTSNHNSQPYGGAPQMNQQYYAPTSVPPVKKNKSKMGKSIFVALICISIIIASIAIGFDLSDGNINNNDKNISDNFNNEKNQAAEAEKEDSPISYSEYSGNGAMTPEQIYKAVKEINVGILVYSKTQKVGEGSGIVVGSDKTKTYTYILTAAHVIAEAGVNVQVQFSDGNEYEATIVGFDSKTDVGVLRIKATGFKAAKFGNSDKLTVGQTVYAIGNPGGTEFFGSFTSGMISAIDRPVPTTNSSYDLPCIQHNAAINPGNSGGALVNEYGQVIGLNSSKISSTEYEGMGFSVPSETVLEVYEELIKNGYVSNRPMLGITYFPVSSDYNYSAIAWKNNLPYGSIVIASISNDSDIAKKDIVVGDIITSVNGKTLDSTDILLEEIENGKVGDKLVLTVYRLNNDGSVNTSFEETVVLVEDKGTNTVQQPETEVDPFSGYFDNFGY